MINWAHSCELPDPWDWLEPFDMLMTNGIGVPADPGAQALYVNRLADAGISAIAVGEDVAAPPISPAMAAASERRALPLLLTAFEVPFAAVARVVAESRTDLEERRRLLKTARIYESLRTATIDGRDAVALFEDLGAELGCRLDVLDLTAWHHAFAPQRVIAAPVRAILRDTLRRCAGHLPAILRLDVDGGAAVAVPIPARQPAALLASSFAESAPELTVLQHASTVAALELERQASERDALSRQATELFADLLADRLDSQRATARLATAALPADALVLAAWWQPDGGDQPPSVHHQLYARGVPHLLHAQAPEMVGLALLRDDGRSPRVLLDALPAGCAVGLSGPVGAPGRVAEAAREARWALHGAAAGRPMVRFGEDGAAAWGFALERSDEIAEHVLGRLRRYDRRHQTELVRTLAVYLRNNRSPSRTAAELFIHRQTLVYRIARIEELTGRTLSETEDVVALWLALRAVEVTEGFSLLGA